VQAEGEKKQKATAIQMNGRRHMADFWEGVVIQGDGGLTTGPEVREEVIEDLGRITSV